MEHLPGVMQRVAIIPPFMPVPPPHHVYTDVTGGFGCGATWGRRWFQYMWPSTFQGRAIASHPGALTHRHGAHDLGPIVGQQPGGGPLSQPGCTAVCVITAGYSRDKDMMHLMHCLFFIKGSGGGPLFQFRNGRYLTKPRFIMALQTVLRDAGIDATQFAHHSFRIDVATTASLCGIQDSMIQTLGHVGAAQPTPYTYRLLHPL